MLKYFKSLYYIAYDIKEDEIVKRIRKLLAFSLSIMTLLSIPSITFAAEPDSSTAYNLVYHPGHTEEIPLEKLGNAWEGKNQASITVDGIGEVACNYNFPEQQLEVTLPWDRDIKKGVYPATITYTQTSNGETSVDNQSLQITVEEDVTGAHLMNTVVAFDGSADVILRFQNGEGENRITEISQINFLAKRGKPEGNQTAGFVLKAADNDFSYNCDTGEILISKDWFQQRLDGYNDCPPWEMPWVYKGTMNFTLANGNVIDNYVVLSNQITNTEGLPKEDFVNDGADTWYFMQFDKWPFTDVPTNADIAWYYPYVKYVYENGLMTGKNETTFAPNETLARAQFAVILHRMENEPEMEYTSKFHDVGADIWYTDAILWASDAGVVTGYSNGNFGPADNINREQMALMMYRYANHLGYDTSKKADFSQYQDASNVSDFADEAMQWAVGMGIITGKYNETILDPQGNATRAECATIIMRFMEAYKK